MLQPLGYDVSKKLPKEGTSGARHEWRSGLKQLALPQPSLSPGVCSLRIRQEHNAFPGRESTHVDRRFIAIRNLVDVIVLVLFRFDIEVHLGTPQAAHVFFNVALIYFIGEHEADHERRINDLAETQLFQHLEGEAPHARCRHVARDSNIDPRPYRTDKLEFGSLWIQERLKCLDGREVTAGMVANRDLLVCEVFGTRNRRVWRDHDATGCRHIGATPHLADMLGRSLIDRPMTGTGNI